MADSTEIRIVFDGPPGPESGRFVECEDASGRSVSLGEWRQRRDGYWELVLTPDDFEASEEVPRGQSR